MTEIAFLIYPRLTVLDAIGPYEVLSRLPGAEVRMVGKEKGPIRSDNGALGLMVDYALDDVPAPDILVVPGGSEGTFAVTQDAEMLAWVRRVHESSQWTTSVCTGALILAAAGVLDGVEATTHWFARGILKDLGAVPVVQRVVQRGKIVTAAGVSAGIDMALHLAAEVAGEEVAQAIQLMIEYAPEPPFASGSRESAPAKVVERTEAYFSGRADALGVS